MTTRTPGPRSAQGGRGTAETVAGAVVYGRVARRLLPLLGLLYLVSYLDRSNIAFAGPNGMNDDLGLSSAAFGLASGIFFIGYSLVEVPSNLALRRFGARVWLVRILVSWGLVAALTALVQNAGQLQVARLLLGIAEAGCLPGIVFYLTLWLPREVRTRLMAGFFVALPLSTALGAPLSALLIQHADGMFGLAGWRAMFVLEGLPALLLAVVVWRLLPDGPQEARWLTERERDWLVARVAAEGTERPGPRDGEPRLGGGWFTPRTFALGFAYFGIIYGLYALSFFLPTIIAGFEDESGGAEFTIVERGLINSVPYVLGAVAMVCWGRYVQRAPRRAVQGVVVPAVVGGISIPLALYMGGPLPTMAVISVCAIGVLSAIPVFWSLPTAMLGKREAAAGIALVNTIGSLGGFAAPYVTGWLRDLTGSVRPGLWLTGGLLIVSALVVTLLRRPEPVTAGAAESPSALSAPDTSEEPV
ncbi:MFS transporter [Streptomyces sp. NBC_01622]|uniref:MFS transporter n=1 Tax=Streptomyces sp. NBC_01622 TaxID=2975903 RepID=UPI00386AFB8C|nr:MFS transporter [Streptomyces sp. NBC_01622]